MATEVSKATLAYAVLTFLMSLPFSMAPGSHVLADLPDTHLFIWTLAWDAHAFLRQPLSIFDANIYYPFANTLAYSENLIGSALFAAPIIWLTGDPVLAMNLTALLTCVLCGAGAYLLARQVHISPGGAFICGLIFAFAPPRFFRMGQLHMTAVQWIPFSLAFLHAYLERGRRRHLLLAVGCFSLQALSSGHGAAYLLLSTLALLGWHVASGRPIALGQRLRDFGVAGAYLLSPAVWILLPYRIAQSEAGLRRDYVAEALPGIESFLASPARFDRFVIEKLWGPFAEEADAFLFPGILVLVLASIALAAFAVTSMFAKTTSADQAERPRSYVALYLLIAVVSTMMFVAWPIEIWRYIYWLPGLNFIRVPSRFIILTMLALSVLAGFGFDRIAARLSGYGRALTMILLSGLLLGEYSSHPFSGVPYTVNIPSIDRWLDTRPKPFVIAEVPVPSAGDAGALERQQTQAMLHSMAHWQKTVHGYSGIRRPFHEELYEQLSAFPDRGSMTRLREAGVTYIVVHTDEYGGRWASVEKAITATPALRLEHVDGTGRVYSILP